MKERIQDLIDNLGIGRMVYIFVSGGMKERIQDLIDNLGIGRMVNNLISQVFFVIGAQY